MKKILMEIKDGEKIKMVFWCPACHNYHWVQINSNLKPFWKFNNDLNKPTFSPSILVKNSDGEVECHLFIKEGNIEYLEDCTHDFKALTIPMHSI